MNKVNNPCLNDITGIVQILYDRGLIYFDEMKSLFVQINNVAWRLWGTDSYRVYIADARHTAAVCEDLAEFKRATL